MAGGAKTAPEGETVMSTRGQVVLPKAVRDRHGWRPGTRFTVEETPEGVLLRRAPSASPTTIGEVIGCLGPADRAYTIEEMNEGIAELFRSEWGRQFDPS